ncbi:hypothetical protein COOONC_28167 [Cooperia oncophora]
MILGFSPHPDIYRVFHICNKSEFYEEAYTFSDGVGMISYGFAAAIAKDMSLGKCVPSCYQFRFRGMKGVVAVNPVLDEIASWASKNEISPPKRNSEFNSWCLKLIFRPSQIKFKAKRTEKDSLEVVKYSSPVPVALNKPFICILDQVFSKYSYVFMSVSVLKPTWTCYPCHLITTSFIKYKLLENNLH